MDMAILQGIQATIASPALNILMPCITYLGENGAIWALIGVILLAIPRTRRWGIVLLAALVVDLVCVEALKHLVARPRPFFADPSIQLLIDPPNGSSFPSGHTSASFCAAVVLLFAPIKRPGKVAAFVLAVLIGFSRLYLQVHYPTDVLAGALIGAGVALVAVFCARRWMARLDARTQQARGKHARR